MKQTTKHKKRKMHIPFCFCIKSHGFSPFYYSRYFALFKLFVFVYMSVLPACVCSLLVCLVPEGVRDHLGFPETGVDHDCELACRSFLEEQSVLLPGEPSLQPQEIIFKKLKKEQLFQHWANVTFS